MELKKLYENTLRVFECKDTEELKNKLYNVVLNNEINIYNEFLEIVNIARTICERRREK